ncbi:MAG: hypothetical protein AAF699_13755 [Pseudomonadota bacterium]
MSQVLFLTLAGADPLTIDELVNAGQMPSFARLHNNAKSLKVLWPQGGSYVGDWLSVATGTPIWRHGAATRRCAKPALLGTAPISRLDLLAPPVWETMAAEDFHCASIGWPATQHSFLEHCDVLSDLFFLSGGHNRDSSPVFAGSMNTRKDPSWFLQYRALSEDLPKSIPKTVRPALAGFQSKVAIAKQLLAEDTDALFLHCDLLEQLGMPGNLEQANAIVRHYGLVDTMLSQLLSAAPTCQVIAIVFRPPSAAFKLSPEEALHRGRVLFWSDQDSFRFDKEGIGPEEIVGIVAAHIGRMQPPPEVESKLPSQAKPDPSLASILESLDLDAVLPLNEDVLQAEKARRKTDLICRFNLNIDKNT